MKHQPIRAFYPAKADDRARIAVLGGGFTGAAATIALLRTTTQPIEITIVEPSTPIGTGQAYGRASERHLLNVRAGEVSVLADRFATPTASALPSAWTAA